VTIETVARQAGLRFQPLQAEYYDFAIPADRWDRPAIRALRELLADRGTVRAELTRLGFGNRENG
jgi:putative molybdopterin biosynthesis protein